MNSHHLLIQSVVSFLTEHINCTAGLYPYILYFVAVADTRHHSSHGLINSEAESDALQRRAAEEAAAEIERALESSSATEATAGLLRPTLLTPLAETPQSVASSEDSVPPTVAGKEPVILLLRPS